MSLPTSRALSPAAIAAALPPLDPPGVRPRSHGIVRPPVDGVGGLPVGQHGRDIGLAQQDGARGAGALDGGGVVLGDEVAPLRHAAGSGQANHVEGLLDRHGEAEEGAALAPCRRLVGGAGLVAGPRRSRGRPLH